MWLARIKSDTIQSILIEHAMQSRMESNYIPLPALDSFYGILMSEIMPRKRKTKNYRSKTKETAQPSPQM